MRRFCAWAFSQLVNARSAVSLVSLTTLALACCALPCLAQHPAAPSAKVTADSLPVYSQMDPSSDVVQTLKKGQPLMLNFQIASATGDWCSVRLPSQSTDLGFVDCSGLKINRPKPVPESGSAFPAEAGPPSTNGGRRTVQLNLAPPVARALNSYDRIKAFVVPQGELDDLKLQQLDAAARGGSPAAMDRAALGHLAAGSFQLSHSDTSDAIDQLGSAVSFSDRNPEIQVVSLVDLAYVHLLRGEYSQALGPLDRARALAPDSVAVARFSGWAYYGMNQLDQAVAQWKRAQQLQPNPQVAAALEKAERDQVTERNFHREENSHFILRYEGGEAPELARQILDTLQTDFQTLQSSLQYTPAAPIGVVLYTNRTFRDVTRAPRWADGLNDGRIRVPVQGISSVDSNLAHVLMHELTHSFVRQMTEGRCPTWLNEGLAQYMEGRRSAENAKVLVTLYQEKKYIPLSRLEGPWTGFPTPVAEFAYAWSLAAVESIVANSGMYGIENLFSQLKQDDSVRTAMGVALQLNYSDLELQTVNYLRQTYLQ